MGLRTFLEQLGEGSGSLSHFPHFQIFILPVTWLCASVCFRSKCVFKTLVVLCSKTNSHNLQTRTSFNCPSFLGSGICSWRNSSWTLDTAIRAFFGGGPAAQHQQPWPNTNAPNPTEISRSYLTIVLLYLKFMNLSLC